MTCPSIVTSLAPVAQWPKPSAKLTTPGRIVCVSTPWVPSGEIPARRASMTKSGLPSVSLQSRAASSWSIVSSAPSRAASVAVVLALLGGLGIMGVLMGLAIRAMVVGPNR